MPVSTSTIREYHTRDGGPCVTVYIRISGENEVMKPLQLVAHEVMKPETFQNQGTIW